MENHVQEISRDPRSYCSLSLVGAFFTLTVGTQTNTLRCSFGKALVEAAPSAQTEYSSEKNHLISSSISPSLSPYPRLWVFYPPLDTTAQLAINKLLKNLYPEADILQYELTMRQTYIKGIWQDSGICGYQSAQNIYSLFLTKLTKTFFWFCYKSQPNKSHWYPMLN